MSKKQNETIVFRLIYTCEIIIKQLNDYKIIEIKPIKYL